MSIAPISNLSDLEAKIEARRRLPPPDLRRAIRRAAGASQTDVAGPLGVHRETISRWERGERTPRGALLDAYLAVLETLQGKSA